MQKITNFSPFDIEIIHIKDESELNELEKKEVNYKFDIINSCLFRFKIAIFENGFGAIILTVNHIIADSWALGLVIKNILSEYHSLQTGASISKIYPSYIDYINSERDYKNSKKYELDKAYWNKVFETIPEPSTIPSKSNTNENFSCDANRVNFSLDSTILEKIKSFCSFNKISIYNFLMAIYAVYISKASRTNDFVLGTPILNRSNYNEKQTMGMFVNTIPVRISMPKQASFSDFLHSLSSNMLSNLKHQKYSYIQILDDLRAKNVSIPNLYNIAISYQITKAYSEGYGNYKTDWVFNNCCSNDINIHLTDLNDTGSLFVSYDYLIEKYDLEDIKNMHKRIMHIIKQVLNTENINLSNIEIITEDEKKQILNNFNNTKITFPKSKSIVNLFEEQVNKSPNNIATIFENQTITFEKLNENSNAIAHYLIESGIARKNLVGILLHRSIDLISTILAVIKSGSSYVLIDPSLPKERIKYILNDSNADFCIVNNSTKNLLESEKIINIDEISISNYSIENLKVDGRDHLCIIYTSGSTGNPKGVILKEDGFINLIYAFDKEMEISKYKKILSIATVSFDMFAVELFSSILFGNALVLANEEEQKNPIAMSDLIKANNVDFLITTPTRIELLLLDECKNPLKNVKAFQLGGEQLTYNLYNRLSKITNAKIFNGYGPTEITACCTNKLVEGKDITIGKPIANMQVYICDSNTNLLPIGLIGEICVGGVGVSDGYINKKDESAKHFIKSPFSDGYIYKTGDLGRYKNNGEIEYIGRSDFQIKIRGQRVELGEIENSITKIPNVSSCVVTKITNVNSSEFLCAYFTASSNIPQGEIRKKLEGLLPRYMIPQYFVQLENLPYTINGKIDRNNLPKPKFEDINKEVVLPRNEIDKRLVKILEKLLKIKSISIDDSFFEIGGDSLSAINLALSIQNEFKAQVTIKEILETPTIHDLSDIIEKNINTVKNKTIAKIKKAEFYPVSSAQRRIYLATTVSGESSTVYNVPGAVILDGKIDLLKLEKCFCILIKRHETLRTYFELCNESVVQKITDDISFKLDIVKDANFEDLHRLFDDFVKPFNLAKAPLFRTKFILFTNGKSALFLDMHHIISDGTSMSILVDELSKLYNDEILPDINITYKDYTAFENKYLQSEKYKEAEDYWLSQFDGEIPVLNLPTNYLRPTIQSFEGKKVYSFIDKELTSKIEKIAENLQITPYMFLLSCYYILLSKYTSQDDIIVGSPVVGRDIEETYNLIGMFVNTLALREKIDNSLSFRDFAISVKEKLLKAYEYQTYPFDELVNKLNIKRESNRNPLFDTMFIYQNNGYRKLYFRNIKSEYYIPDTRISKFDLSLEAIPCDNEIKLSFEYATTLFTEQFIKNLSNHYLNIIKAILKNVDSKIANVDMLSEDETNTILRKFNNTKTDYEKKKTISMLFEEQVLKTPDNIAVIFENKELTYNELNEKANSLAHFLRNKGIGRNDLVGIMVSRSLEMIVAILAVLKAGAAYIPIDPSFPKDRIEYMLNSSNSKMLLTQKKLDEKIFFENKIFIDLNNSSNKNENNNDIYSISTENLENNNEPEDSSYVIFTSGSTGLPKGVVLTHKALSNLTNYCNHYIEYLKIPKYQAVVSITTMSFDIFIFETLISLQKGLKLIIANENEQNIPRLLNDLIEKHNVKIIQATPSRMQLFINNINDFPSLSKLKYITLAGEQLPLSLVQSLHNLSKCTVYNGYGPSETTVFSTLTKMDGEEITIGKPLDNTQIYILDNNLKPVPVGIVGELYISGDGVGKGYLNNEKLTKSCFIQNPFILNSVMYKTGDLGMYTENGEILCLGRSDNQVKIRGQRIELEEIEDKLSKIPSIKSCTVVKTIDKYSHEYLCAYFTSSTDIASNVIRKYLEDFLPKYMIPQYFIKLENLPYTPNGKIDRKKLPEPKYENNNRELVLPRNEIDSKLIDIIKSLLNVDSVSITDSFFELGGDSLSAINLCVRVHAALNSQIFVKDVLENSIIQDLSDIICKNINKSKKDIIKNIKKAEFYTVSTAQKRMYFASKLAGETSTLYNIPCCVILDGIIDIKKLESCFISLINRHETLRTYFDLNGQTVTQRVLENVNFKIDILKSANFEDLNLLFMDFVKPFDLSKAPLFRAKFIEFTNGKSALFIDMHHIISDGTSMNILVNEICKLYNNETLPELNITYKDFAFFENDRLSSGKLKNAEDYWVSQFEGEVPILNMPTKNPRPAVQSFEGKRIYSTINESDFNKIEQLCEKLGITPYMLLLSVYYVLLSKYTSQNDIIVGSPVVGRDIEDTFNLIGMFVNTLALRKKIDTSLPFKDFVLSVKDTLLKAYEYQTYPFDELVNKLNIKRDTSRNPLFDTMFIYQNTGFKGLEVNGVKANYYSPDVGNSKFDLSLELVPNNNCINITFEYATKLFDNEFIENLSKHYLNILNVILENINIKIANIDMLGNEEKNKILYEFNNTAMKYDKNKTLSILFEEQVEKTPNNIALIFEDKKLTYKELNEKANSLAYYLRNNGVTRNSLVGIMVNRSFEMIIAILAVLKAGGAYIPIDPTYPKDRIEYMLNSSNSKILLTQKHLDEKINFENKLFIDLSNNEIYSFPNNNLENINTPEDLSYVIFTSGSTGLPKGVMLTHKALSNLTNYCNNYISYLKEPAYQAIASITTMSFDIFIFETLISLQKGLKLIIANENEQNMPNLLNALIKKHDIKIIQATPSRMQIFMNNISDMPSLSNLKYITLAGEQLPLNLVKELHNLCDCTVYNGYGPSETTVFSTLTKMDGKIVTIGKPLDNTQIYILDNNLKPVPVGITGEIYIAGDGVGKGYLNNEDLTKKSFIQNPFIPNSIMYKTGDLGMYTNDGNILCLGRSDNQVKIRGLRIELGEIESLIEKFPNIVKVAVLKQSINNREFISAYFVARNKIVKNELRKYLSASLPKYMVPSYYIHLDDFPYTPNGKIDKKALPLPTEILNVHNEQYIAPKTTLQKQIVSIWEKILNISPIGINDNFFELGGDSLLAMNLNIELLKISNKLKYSDIFRYPTIAELEEKINSTKDEPTFSKIENLSDNYVDVLKNCTKKDKVTTWHPRNILLTGATGFLGVHIIKQLIKYESGKIFCIVRDGHGLTAKARLHQKLNYYFGNKYDNLIDTRIIAINGDISKPGFGLNQEVLLELANSVDVVINSAANVAHFGNYKDFYTTNVLSVKHIIDFCNSFKKKLYHISTMSVAAVKLDSSYLSNNKNHDIIFDESCLYVGQILDNVYMRSKFEAESYVLEAISNGLDAYILRIGHLMPRYKDGIFQENFMENEFVFKCISYAKLGIIPNYIQKIQLDATPVDYTAKAIYKLLTHPTSKNRIFHLYNHKMVTISRYVKIFKRLKFNIEILPEKEFKDKINTILQNENTKNMLNNIINDFDENLHVDYTTDIKINSTFTIKYLRKLNFRWPRISNRYIIRFVNLLRKVI